MPTKKAKPTSVDEYIEAAPQHAQAKLRELRVILKQVAPQATEALKWGMPVFEAGRILFSYAAFKTTLNFMPTAPALKPFKKELAQYTTSQETVKFPYDKPLPKTLIRKIAKHRLKDVQENDAKWMYNNPKR